MRRCQNFDIVGLKICHRVSFWGAPTHVAVTEFQNFLLQLKNQRSRSKTVCGFSFILILKGIVLNELRFKVKESMHFAEQKYKLIKMKWNRKWKIPHTALETNLVLQLV